MIVNAGTILANFHPDAVDDCMASTGFTSADYSRLTFYMTGVPAPILGSPTPVIMGIEGAPKVGLMTYAALTLGNQGLQPIIGSAYGNSLQAGLVDTTYALRIDTTQASYFDQAVITAQGGNWGYHGDTGVPDNNPISSGRITFAADVNGANGFSACQLRAIVGYDVAHDMATSLAINAILAG